VTEKTNNLYFKDSGSILGILRSCAVTMNHHIFGTYLEFSLAFFCAY